MGKGGSIRSTLISRHHPIGLIGVEPTNFIGEEERERVMRIVMFLIRVCGPRRVESEISWEGKERKGISLEEAREF